jgi:Tol biopolymer transport system component
MLRDIRGLAALGLVPVALGASGISAAAQAATTERISVSSTGEQGNADSPGRWGYQAWLVAFSEHGRFVAFASDASNLVRGDTNRATDIFLRDRKRHTTTRLSVDSSGRQANGPSFGLAMTPDARFIAFNSRASNLVARDTNQVGDIFVRDRQTGTTSRVSVSSSGAQALDDYAAPEPAISDDGRFVAFASGADNLVSVDQNPYQDVFVHDRESGETTLESVRSDGVQSDSFSGSPDISGHGRRVAFTSEATSFRTGRRSPSGSELYIRDRSTAVTRQVSEPGIGASSALGTPSNVHLASRAGVVLYGRNTEVIAVGLNSGRRRCVACWTEPGIARWSHPAGISANGRITAFQSEKSSLVERDTNRVTDAFVRGWMRSRAIRVSVSANGTQATQPSTAAGISPDGRFAAFISSASAFVAGDTNRHSDVFIRGPLGR